MDENTQHAHTAPPVELIGWMLSQVVATRLAGEVFIPDTPGVEYEFSLEYDHGRKGWVITSRAPEEETSSLVTSR